MTEYHVVFDEIAAGHVRGAGFQNIIKCEDDLSIGPIHELDIASGRKKRVKWLQKVWDYHLKGNNVKKNMPLDTAAYARLWKVADNPNHTIVFWAGANSMERVGLYRALAGVLRSQQNLFLIEPTEMIKDEKKGKRVLPHSIGQCSSEVLQRLYTIKVKLKATHLKHASKVWKKILKEKSFVRVAKPNGIWCYSEDHFDGLILRTLSKNFIPLLDIIAEILSLQHIKHQYLLWRAFEFDKENIVEIKGKYRQHQIRRM